MLAMATARVPLDSLCLRVSLMGLGHPAKILAKARCFPCAAQFLSWATCVCSKVTSLCIGFTTRKPMQRHDLVQVYANEEALSAAEALVQIFQSEET